jgi:hypothetical protein
VEFLRCRSQYAASEGDPHRPHPASRVVTHPRHESPAAHIRRYHAQYNPAECEGCASSGACCRSRHKMLGPSAGAHHVKVQTVKTHNSGMRTGPRRFSTMADPQIPAEACWTNPYFERTRRQNRVGSSLRPNATSSSQAVCRDLTRTGLQTTFRLALASLVDDGFNVQGKAPELTQVDPASWTFRSCLFESVRSSKRHVLSCRYPPPVQRGAFPDARPHCLPGHYLR